VGIVSGATYTVWDLWNGLLLPSGNDAATALANQNGGVTKTVAAMQSVAHQLQALDTHVVNPSGLDADGQVSSAYDMALIAAAAMKLPDFRTVTNTKSYAFPGFMPKSGKARKTFQIYTENRLLRHNYPGIVGGKTGFTSLAHRTFWAAADRNGHTLIVTLFQIHQTTESAAQALLNWGFANRTKVNPVGTLVSPTAAVDQLQGASLASSSPSSESGGVTATNASADQSTQSSVASYVGLVVGIGMVLAGVIAVWMRRRTISRRKAARANGRHLAGGAATQRETVGTST
jgi:D-alanyl-D-alanine carboxypeptidase (penicillin-binding protein 5/6)